MSLSIDLKDIPSLLPRLSLVEQEALLNELDQLTRIREQDAARDHFLSFVKAMWPVFIYGAHHAKMAAAFERVINGKCKRLILNLPPRSTKSELTCWLLVAWFLGKFPGRQVIQCSHTADLATDFGRKVRDLIDTDEYRAIFPGTKLKVDNKGAGKWATTEGGVYFAVGSGGAVTGRGADLLVIDDIHSEQDAKQAEYRPEIFDMAYEWYTSGPRQRLQPDAAIIIIQTRWSKRDLTGRVLLDEANGGQDHWEVIEFPAILPSGAALWPEFWPLDQIIATKSTISNSKWMAQYMQSPVSEQAAIIKREWWQLWNKPDPPTCDFTLMTWDTAFEKTQRSDYSAMTHWGVFYKEDDTGARHAHIVLLNAFRDKLEFPELKKAFLRLYKEAQPDSVIIEKKASGAPLIYEMRAMGIPVSEFTPTRGNDKISRLNAIADIFQSGRVWRPDMRFAEEVVDEVGDFPSGLNDDFVDCTSMALARFRQGGYVGTALDEPEEPVYWRRKAVGYY